MSEPRTAARQEEAARWFAALRRGVMSLEERAAYESWLSDRANRAAMAGLEETWNALGLVADRALDPGTAAPPASARARLARPALVAAMCAASLGIGLLSYSGDSPFWTALDWTDR